MRFSIFKRLAIGYAAIMILVIFMGVYVTLKLIQIKRLTHDAALVDSAIVRQVDQLFDTLFTQVSFEEKYLISKDQDFYNKFWEVEENFLKDIGKLESLLQTPEVNKLFVRVIATYKKYLSLFQQQVLGMDKNSDQLPWQYHNEKEKLIDTINQDPGLSRKKRLI